jgi:phosphoribosylpyrophosphate synthetase
MLTMEIKSKVSKFSNGRKIVEIPTSVRDNFEIGDVVYIVKK